MAQSQLPKLEQEKLKHLWESKHLSDVVIQCEGRTFEAHKLVLTLRSDIFSRKFERWDTNKPLDLTDEIPSVVEAMLHYMYLHDYDVPTSDVPMSDQDETPASDLKETVAPIVFHVRVYAIAVKYSVLELQELAVRKFRDVAPDLWESDDFLQAIDEIYESTHKAEQDLRKVVVDIAKDHIDELLSRENFTAVLEDNGEFACGVLKATRVREHPGVPEYKCPRCSGRIRPKWRGKYDGYCFHCKGYQQDWRYYVVS